MGQQESTVFNDCIIINNDLKPRRIHFYKSIETLKSMTIDKIKKPFYPTNFSVKLQLFIDAIYNKIDIEYQRGYITCTRIIDEQQELSIKDWTLLKEYFIKEQFIVITDENDILTIRWIDLSIT